LKDVYLTAPATAAPPCKGCTANVRLRADEVERLLREYLETHSGRPVPDSVYEERLAICRTCSALQYGTTCRHCGCLVQILARLADRCCPRPGGRKW
jgi:hypothetical protein